MGVHPARWSLSNVRQPGHDWLTRKVSVPRGCARACAKGPQRTSLCSNIEEEKEEGEEIRERKRKEEEKSRDRGRWGAEGQGKVKRTCVTTVHRFLLTMADLIAFLKKRRQDTYKIDIYLLSLCCRKRRVDARSKGRTRSSLNGWQSHHPLQPSDGTQNPSQGGLGISLNRSHLCSVCKQPFVETSYPVGPSFQI